MVVIPYNLQGRWAIENRVKFTEAKYKVLNLV